MRRTLDGCVVLRHVCRVSCLCVCVDSCPSCPTREPTSVYKRSSHGGQTAVQSKLKVACPVARPVARTSKVCHIPSHHMTDLCCFDVDSSFLIVILVRPATTAAGRVVDHYEAIGKPSSQHRYPAALTPSLAISTPHH